MSFIQTPCLNPWFCFKSKEFRPNNEAPDFLFNWSFFFSRCNGDEILNLVKVLGVSAFLTDLDGTTGGVSWLWPHSSVKFLAWECYLILRVLMLVESWALIPSGSCDGEDFASWLNVTAVLIEISLVLWREIVSSLCFQIFRITNCWMRASHR